ncbi:MAG: hypothetical protein WCT18_01815 [Patescibacteria group bacterium]
MNKFVIVIVIVCFVGCVVLVVNSFVGCENQQEKNIQMQDDLDNEYREIFNQADILCTRNGFVKAEWRVVANPRYGDNLFGLYCVDNKDEMHLMNYPYETNEGNRFLEAMNYYYFDQVERDVCWAMSLNYDRKYKGFCLSKSGFRIPIAKVRQDYKNGGVK